MNVVNSRLAQALLIAVGAVGTARAQQPQLPVISHLPTMPDGRPVAETQAEYDGAMNEYEQFVAGPKLYGPGSQDYARLMQSPAYVNGVKAGSVHAPKVHYWNSHIRADGWQNSALDEIAGQFGNVANSLRDIAGLARPTTDSTDEANSIKIAALNAIVANIYPELQNFLGSSDLQGIMYWSGSKKGVEACAVPLAGIQRSPIDAVASYNQGMMAADALDALSQCTRYAALGTSYTLKGVRITIPTGQGPHETASLANGAHHVIAAIDRYFWINADVIQSYSTLPLPPQNMVTQTNGPGGTFKPGTTTVSNGVAVYHHKLSKAEKEQQKQQEQQQKNGQLPPQSKVTPHAGLDLSRPDSVTKLTVIYG